MAFHSHDRGNKGYGGADASRGESARALPTFEQQEEQKRAREEAARLLGEGLEPAPAPPEGEGDSAPSDAPHSAPAPELERIPEPAPPKRRTGKKPPPVADDGGKGYRVSEIDISEIKRDLFNARRHNPRNIGLIVEAIQEVGAARSIVIDEDNTLMAGEGATDAGAEAGIRRVVVVDTDGETMVAVRRSGLTPEQKTRLALYDNRAGELSEFDATALADLTLGDDPGTLEGLFTEDEIEAIRVAAELEAAQEENAEADAGPLFGPEGMEGKKERRPRRMAYRLDFDNATQKREFEAFVRYLTSLYGDDDTPAGVWSAFLHEHYPTAIGLPEPEADPE